MLEWHCCPNTRPHEECSEHVAADVLDDLAADILREAAGDSLKYWSPETVDN